MKHLSGLRIDQIASGLPPEPEASAHLGSCPDCTARLEQVRRDAEAARSLPGYRAGLLRLRHAAPEPRRGARLLWALLAPAAAATAACIALVCWMLQPAPSRPALERGTERVKGSAAIWLVRTGEEQPVTALAPGDEVALVARGEGATRALVLAVDEAGAVATLWPPGAEESGALPARGGGRLDPAFRVTPGSFVVLALFSASPLRAAAARSALERAVAACPARPLPLGCPGPGPLPGEQGRARAFFSVTPERR